MGLAAKLFYLENHDNGSTWDGRVHLTPIGTSIIQAPLFLPPYSLLLSSFHINLTGNHCVVVLHGFVDTYG